MSSSLSFASAFVHGFVALESEDTSANLLARSRLYIATLPLPAFEAPSNSSSEDPLKSSVSRKNVRVSLTVFFEPGKNIYVPGEIIYVCAKFVAVPGTRPILDASIHLPMNVTVEFKNAPDIMPCPIHLCGRVETIYNDLPGYGDYRAFDVKTSSWIKECGGRSSFEVRVLVPGNNNKRFTRTPLPHVGSILNAHGTLLGRDISVGLLVLELKDFSFLPRGHVKADDATAADSVITPDPSPRKKGWNFGDDLAAPSPMGSSVGIPAQLGPTHLASALPSSAPVQQGQKRSREDASESGEGTAVASTSGSTASLPTLTSAEADASTEDIDDLPPPKKTRDSGRKKR